MEQQKALGSFEPDYILYQSGTDRPIAIVEAKRSGQNLAKALKQAAWQYARPLNVDIVFVADGAIIESYDLRKDVPLRMDDDLVTTLLNEKQILRHIEEGASIYTPDIVRHTKQELIQVFSEANNLLRKEGLREGIERFSEFSNLLFLKLISEIENERDRIGEKRILEKNIVGMLFVISLQRECLTTLTIRFFPGWLTSTTIAGMFFKKNF